MIDFDADPIELFHRWQAAARGELERAPEPLRAVSRWTVGLGQRIAAGLSPSSAGYWGNVAALATASPEGRPSVRMVLLKQASELGFVFYTSYESRKAREIAANPLGSLAVFWPLPPRQVRVEGPVERLTRQKSLRYWQSRSRGAQLSASASRQSAPIPDREELVLRVQELDEELRDQPVPLPDTWGGYRLVPESLEFWEGRPDRLHDRIRFDRDPSELTGWAATRLQP
ncbi:MAG: pyridoxamine 5'-phosphate oxidase [Deltaproteobacteria bacterium]|jgi:pyridoxamine 5'-phosphate oxidase|nr:pyridoxamine 5'-phosphate oxidase [Deltaproteobacteria bacterium]MBW2533614.1 pyridoxamine 5'-phosphate oxidase [Deltaproteobacteria bacterium]